jgi:hypothetical protein
MRSFRALELKDLGNHQARAASRIHEIMTRYDYSWCSLHPNIRVLMGHFAFVECFALSIERPARLKKKPMLVAVVLGIL